MHQVLVRLRRHTADEPERETRLVTGELRYLHPQYEHVPGALDLHPEAGLAPQRRHVLKAPEEPLGEATGGLLDPAPDLQGVVGLPAVSPEPCERALLEAQNANPWPRRGAGGPSGPGRGLSRPRRAGRGG